MTDPRRVHVPAARVVRWFDNFEGRHGAASLTVTGGALSATASDGAQAVAHLPFDRSYDGPADPAAFAAATADPVRWGLLVVRRGGFAVAGGAGPSVGVRKVGRRHVQGKTKAGGWSQQRYARRRDNQARTAFEAAADHAVRLLVDELGGVSALVTGGDRKAVEDVLADARLREVAARRTSLHLALGDPDAGVVDKAVADLLSAVVVVTDPAD
ncbi:acVLRF1 family peptidyl-tRNA hydrolase [Nocardioides marmoribigeumensis]|uniref:Actinobacteria/chloroflexi VLRF1 release factor domain-containing protein n=1 Tax=Nocardioides marmoribigeumensis TaxID=433649 RepID=A0ABU2C1D5_9ACTN|nr:acVLRF1 family peptidyl-tRNA hydrolase [Nocardioides marmoribigeumensis]MDR7364476.1 hypothetical protein [Nocardioides marmoribigeumensis]